MSQGIEKEISIARGTLLSLPQFLEDQKWNMKSSELCDSDLEEDMDPLDDLNDTLSLKISNFEQLYKESPVGKRARIFKTMTEKSVSSKGKEEDESHEGDNSFNCMQMSEKFSDKKSDSLSPSSHTKNPNPRLLVSQKTSDDNNPLSKPLDFSFISHTTDLGQFKDQRCRNDQEISPTKITDSFCSRNKFSPSFCNHEVKSIGELRDTLNNPNNNFLTKREQKYELQKTKQKMKKWSKFSDIETQI